MGTEGVLDELKEAFLIPSLKNIIMNSDDLKHLHPISNLTYIFNRDQCGCTTCGTCKREWFGRGISSSVTQYYIGHIQVAHVKVHNGLICAVDEGKVVVIVLLDLSVVFDMVNHDILLQRLHTYLGLPEVFHGSVPTLINNNKQIVITVIYSPSTMRDLQYGFPQGSMLGSLLFLSILYLLLR